MKKILFLLLLALPFVFNSCSDDDDDVNKETLNGTTWIATDNTEGHSDKWVLEFSDTSYKLTFTCEDGMDENYTDNGAYTYTYPKVFLIENGYSSELLISGNTMVTVVDEDDDWKITFKKQ